MVAERSVCLTLDLCLFRTYVKCKRLSDIYTNMGRRRGGGSGGAGPGVAVSIKGEMGEWTLSPPEESVDSDEAGE